MDQSVKGAQIINLFILDKIKLGKYLTPYIQIPNGLNSKWTKTRMQKRSTLKKNIEKYYDIGVEKDFLYEV